MPDAGECKRPAGKDPSSWGVEEVVWFIKDADPQALGPHAEAFRKHVSPEDIISQVTAAEFFSDILDGLEQSFIFQHSLEH